MKTPVCICLLFLTLLVTIPLTLAEDPPTTWYVDASVSVSGDGRSPDTAFKTIHEGIAAANDWDTVDVAAGEYLPTELIVLTRGVSLIGAGADVTTISTEQMPYNALIQSFSTNITIEGFTFVGGNTITISPTGNTSYIDIRNNKFIGEGVGSGFVVYCDDLYCQDVSVIVENNIFYGYEYSAINVIVGGTQVGPTLQARNNTILNVRNGIVVQNPASIIENNIIAGASYAGIVPRSWTHDQNIQYNLFWNNHMDTISEADWPTDQLLESWAVLGEGNIFSDPMLNDNFQLLTGSPAIDAGNPVQTDPDGTRRDIGAFNGLLPLDFVSIDFDLPTAVPLRTSVPTSVPTISGTVTLQAHAPTLSTTLTLTYGLTNTQTFTMTQLDPSEPVSYPIAFQPNGSGWVDIEATVTWPTGQHSASHRVLVSTHETYLPIIMKVED